MNNAVYTFKNGNQSFYREVSDLALERNVEFDGCMSNSLMHCLNNIDLYDEKLSILAEEKKSWLSFSKEDVYKLFGDKALGVYQVKSNYWGGRNINYMEDARPAWLVKTPIGLIELQPRKRVMSIDWSDTKVRTKVDDSPSVTQTDSMVHAWCSLDIINCLNKLFRKGLE